MSFVVYRGSRKLPKAPPKPPKAPPKAPQEIPQTLLGKGASGDHYIRKSLRARKITWDLGRGKWPKVTEGLLKSHLQAAGDEKKTHLRAAGDGKISSPSCWRWENLISKQPREPSFFLCSGAQGLGSGAQGLETTGQGGEAKCWELCQGKGVKAGKKSSSLP